MAWDINTEADYVQEEIAREYFNSYEIYERIKRSFYKKIRSTEGGCWVWTSQYKAQNGEPYLVFKTPETTEFDARQIAYNYHIDTLFAGEKITMSCGNTMCVNPAHMNVKKEKEMEQTFTGISYPHLRGKAVKYWEHGEARQETIIEAAASGPYGSPDQGVIVLTEQGNILDSLKCDFLIVD